MAFGSGLGGLDDRDFDLIARTIIGEAGNQPLAGQQAIGHVVMNRLNSGRYGASVPDILFAPKQFTPWMTRRNELMGIPTTDPRYQQALDIAKTVGRGLVPDNTGGATHFANYAASDPVNQRGWVGQMLNQPGTIKIGAHHFGSPDSQPGAVVSKRDDGGEPRVVPQANLGLGGRVDVASADPRFAPSTATASADSASADNASATTDSLGLGGWSGVTGNLLSAVGASLLSSPRDAPLSGVPGALQAQADLRGKEDDRRIRQLTLQNALRNTEADNKRADAQLEISRQQLGLSQRGQEYNQLGPIGQKMRQFYPQLDPIRDRDEYLKKYKELAQSTDSFSKTPVWGVDASGNPVLLQVGEGGTAVQTKLPEGVRVGKDPIRIDAGTNWVLLDPVTRQVIGTVSKNIGQTKVEEITGQATGKAQVDLPTVRDNALQMQGHLDYLLDDKNKSAREWVTGKSSIIPRFLFSGSPQEDYLSRVDQLQGESFLDGVKSMVGLGALSDAEGKKIDTARARLKTSQSEEGFVQSLKEIKEIVARGVERTKAMAKGGGPSAGTGTPAAPRMRFDQNGDPIR